MDAPLIRFWLRELPAVLTVLVLVGGIALFYYWLYPRPGQQDRLSGEITGFHGFLNKRQFGNTVRASVRLGSGLIVQVPLPRSGPALHCRRGDSIALIGNGGLYRVGPEACSGR
jgi:hypothetical protein